MIYDSDNNQILATSVALESGETETLEIIIDCEDGKSLSCGNVAALTITGRHSDASTWTNLESGAIDLSTWDGTAQTFFIKIEAGTITTYDQASFSLTVS